MASITARPGDGAAARPRRFRRLMPGRWILFPLAVFAAAAGWVGFHAWHDYRVLTSAKYSVS